MALNHDNPTRPRRDRDGNEIWARAPYNFVPLPNKVVAAQQPLPRHDRYDKNLLTGWIDCELETCSPTYVRGMLTEQQFEEQGRAKPDELERDEIEKRAPFFATSDEEVDGRLVPVLPGSSLRGMVRSLVEVASYGRVRWIGKEPVFTFRAVAAAKDDPLRDPYRDVLGPFGRNVRAGYLERVGSDWYVRPALLPDNDMGWPERSAYLKVKERQIGSSDIPGYIRLNSADYHPQLHRVSFDIAVAQGKRGRYVRLNQIGPRDAGYEHDGVLVCSGNMLETGSARQKSPRRNHALVLAPNPDPRTRIRISQQALEDYQASLTPFERDELGPWGSGPGCFPQPEELRSRDEDAPVYYKGEDGTRFGPPLFYVSPDTTPEDEVVYFGHSPNFRIPARHEFDDGRRATRPPDFAPSEIYDTEKADLADAIFGWVEEKEGGPKEQRAGRVFFEDARFEKAEDDVWLSSRSITPHVLSGPKATTFQHYLVQDRSKGHDPDNKSSLAHYGTPPNETAIRGHKFYWHKGGDPDIEATTEERKHESQLTRIIPVKQGVHFKFRVRFENLRGEELGALLWALTLPGDGKETYRHHLGMGKPLGMGAVEITPTLYLTQRDKRYRQLFADEDWHEPVQEIDGQQYVEDFERFVRRGIDASPEDEPLAELDRIQALLALHEWHESDRAWLDRTRYMEIEHGPSKINEYSERPVLPDPLAVVGRKREGPEVKADTDRPTRLEDLEPGMEVEGRVDGIANFGAFIDLGVGHNGLVHISKLKDGWVDNVANVVKEGQRVRVRVLDVDLQRKRISLSMIGVSQQGLNS